MTRPLQIRPGFDFDEAILMAQFTKQVYELFQYDDGSIEDTELKEIYNSIHRNQGWTFVHSIRNDQTNVRGFILKNPGANQYVLVFRGSIVTDRGSLELTDLLISDTNWELVSYGAMADPRIKVSEGFFEAFESVSDQVEIFFKTLLGRLTKRDFIRLEGLTPERQFACAMAMADAGSIRLSNEFEQQARTLILNVVADGEIGNNEELIEVLEFKKQNLLALETLSEPVDVYVTGHSLGGCLANLGALALRRYFGSMVDSGLAIKVYTIGAPKIGNQNFVNYYNEQIGAGLSHRVENLLDVMGPVLPPSPPFPLNVLAPNGLRIGNFSLANYAAVGEVHTLIGLGSQNVSLDFGGAIEFLGGIPFPHSFDAYIQLLKEDKQRWHQFSLPIKNILSPFFKELLQEQVEEIADRFKVSNQALADQIIESIHSLKNGQGIAQDSKESEIDMSRDSVK